MASEVMLYGLASTIPFCLNQHYLLVDVDSEKIQESKTFLERHEIRLDWVEKTIHGYHIYSLQAFKLEELVVFMPLVPNIDKAWFQIGLNRGYWFLWTQSPFPLDLFFRHPVKFMRLNVSSEGNGWLNTKRLLTSMNF